METGEAEQVVRLAVIGLGGGLAVGGAWLRAHWAGRSERLRLLDSVGAVADGSLPLAETLRRVTEVIVPGFSDICMVDAIHEGGVSRIAVRAGGRDDADRGRGDACASRPPALPEWLVRGERSWRHMPQWWPQVGDEELRRMAHSHDGPRVPARARTRARGS